MLAVNVPLDKKIVVFTMRFVAAYRSLVMFIVIFERSKLVLIWSTKLRQSPLFLETKSPVRVHNPNQVH
jgi:hypothetical protein